MLYPPFVELSKGWLLLFEMSSRITARLSFASLKGVHVFVESVIRKWVGNVKYFVFLHMNYYTTVSVQYS